MKYKKLLLNSIITLASLLLLAALVVYIFDPFFHYHKPLPGLKAVLTDKEYQCVGTLRNFDYDCVIAGSSVCENYNNYWFDAKYDVTSIKAIKSYGGIADLVYYLDVAYENHNLKRVVFNIDPAKLAAPSSTTFEESGCPMYLFDNNPFNDIEYLLNKDVLFEKIPYMISKSLIGDYDEGNSYNWAQWKSFGESETLSHYYSSKDILEMKDADYYADNCEANIDLLEELIQSHPETEFIFFYPPYSVLWFDRIYKSGDTQAYLYNMKACAERLVTYSNVAMYSFISDEAITTDLNNYMDDVHFSDDINYYVVTKLGELEYQINSDNLDSRFDDIYRYATQTAVSKLNEYGAMIQQEQ